ncbi:MAG TPA: citrate lyase subunit alpha [Bacteroidales bacterium]|jgi:citrate lyase subunit alpha/citrate CoA-transferase|nr:citrate lyase subunit alpha [Bacteroidales bacterium]MDI9533898.1 citrate lyase subunit alpha [Bacteroidota bacterium]MBK7733521.1 citrate lyase subunit alpha [Bacteroidales bacterium]MBP7035490.1 citrate lyase subunit alpha [Bacteroidales bacterium]MBP8708920.1 citrate lyase subunit alpha [Bacteroidales bacterium]
MKLVENAAGRLVPDEINGKEAIPFMGVGKYRPSGRKYGPSIPTCIDYPEDNNKVVGSLKEALVRCGLKDGMTVSTHHHLRDGDLVSNQIFAIASELGVKDLVWLPSASFPCNDPVIQYLEDGTVNRIEGSMNGPLGMFVSEGRMKGMAVLRSHGGRVQAIQDGDVKIDIAVLAAPAADSFGNARGTGGPSATGVIGYAKPDYLYAEKVIVVTDNLVNLPCFPMEIEGNYVDYVVVTDKIGIPEKIVSGTTQITKSPDRLLIAELTTSFLEKSGLLRDGATMQAGAGGTSLAIAVYVHQLLKKNGWKLSFGFGGSTKYMVDMLEEGHMGYILDAQAFDLDSVASIEKNLNHIAYPVFNAYNYHSKGNLTTMMDIMILGATEIDTGFNGNVVTHSDGLLLHGIGGWQNCLHARNVIVPVPLFRDRIPVIVDRVTTLCGPGELIDVIITERGIAINPRRQDLIDAVRGKGLPLVTIEELKDIAEKICGKPEKADFDDRVVAAIKWVDGTVIDAVRKVKR